MSKKIFISGSIKIRVLPDAIKEKLEAICQKNEQVLVGDADGVDSLIQNFFVKEHIEILQYTRYILLQGTIRVTTFQNMFSRVMKSSR